MAFNRYGSFIDKGTMHLVPFIEVPASDTDYYVYYEQGVDRLDILSYRYYGDPNYDWLILQANPEVTPLEFNIKDKELLRIPYPLGDALALYNEKISEYKRLEGFE